MCKSIITFIFIWDSFCFFVFVFFVFHLRCFNSGIKTYLLAARKHFNLLFIDLRNDQESFRIICFLFTLFYISFPSLAKPVITKRDFNLGEGVCIWDTRYWYGCSNSGVKKRNTPFFLCLLWNTCFFTLAFSKVYFHAREDFIHCKPF